MRQRTKLLLALLVPLLMLSHHPALVAAWNHTNLLQASPTPGPIYLPLVPKDESPIEVPTLKWQHGGCYASYCETAWYSSPAVADLEGDGSIEVIAADYSIFILDGETGAVEDSMNPDWGSRMAKHRVGGPGAGWRPGDRPQYCIFRRCGV